MNPEAHFRATAPAYMRRFLSDFPKPGGTRRAAVFGNAGHESKGLTDDQEDKPVVKGSRGGRNGCSGLGPRRRRVRGVRQGPGLDRRGDEAAYRFLVQELRGSEKASLKPLLRATTLKGKTEGQGEPPPRARRIMQPVCVGRRSRSRPAGPPAGRAGQ